MFLAIDNPFQVTHALFSFISEGLVEVPVLISSAYIQI